MNSKSLIFLLCRIVFSGLLTGSLVSCGNADPDSAKVTDSSKSIALMIGDRSSKDDTVGLVTEADLIPDQKFLNWAEQINLREIHFGKLAQSRSTSLQIQKLGKMMEDQHTARMAELKIMAALKSIPIKGTFSNEKSAIYIDLSRRSGTDFDNAFINEINCAHLDAIATFEKASTQSQDPQIKAWALSMLPTLQMHVDQSVVCLQHVN